MLSVFPTLLIYQLVAPLMLRLVLGAIFVDFGWSKVTRQKNAKAIYFDSISLKPGMFFVWLIGIIEMVSGLLLVAGMFTQAAALVTSLILFASLFLKKRSPSSFESGFGFLFLAFVISLSLMLTGPGFLAFDLPL